MPDQNEVPPQELEMAMFQFEYSAIYHNWGDADHMLR